MKTRWLLAGILLAGVLAALVHSPAPADVRAGEAALESTTVRLPAAADVSLAAEFPDDNFSNPAFPFLEVEYWHDLQGVLTYVRIFLIRFDLTGLPPDAIIDSAEMQLHWNGCQKNPIPDPIPLGAFFVTSDWVENTVTYNTRPGWASVGLNNPIPCPPLSDPTSWNVTSFAQAWQSDPAHNYGLKVSAPWMDGYDYSITFNSREYTGTDLDPALVITYHQPATSTPTPTITRTPSMTPTLTSTHTPSQTLTPSSTASMTKTHTPTLTPSATKTKTPTHTPSGSPVARLALPLLQRLFPPATASPTASPPGCSEVLGNGGFQSGTLPPWFSVGDAGPGLGRISTYGAWLGGRNNAIGELDQHVSLPAGANTVRWEFWWKAETAAAQPNDLIHVRIEVEGSEPILLTLRAEGALNTWRQDGVDLSAYAGKTLMVSYLVQTDGSTPTTFRLDDASIRACSG